MKNAQPEPRIINPILLSSNNSQRRDISPAIINPKIPTVTTIRPRPIIKSTTLSPNKILTDINKVKAKKSTDMLSKTVVLVDAEGNRSTITVNPKSIASLNVGLQVIVTHIVKKMLCCFDLLFHFEILSPVFLLQPKKADDADLIPISLSDGTTKYVTRYLLCTHVWHFVFSVSVCSHINICFFLYNETNIIKILLS